MASRDISGRGAGGNDQGVAGVGSNIADQGKWLFGQFGSVDVVINDFGFKTLGVFLKAFHQFRALHAV